MPLPCTICGHVDRAAIDAMIVSGASNRAVARHDWSGGHVSKDAVLRHKGGHISSALARVVAEREEAGPRSAFDRLDEIDQRLMRWLDRVEAEGQTSQGVAIAREIRSLIELKARITGELDERPQVNVMNVATNPEHVRMRTVLMETLAAYPEAAVAVSGRLAELESGA